MVIVDLSVGDRSTRLHCWFVNTMKQIHRSIEVHLSVREGIVLPSITFPPFSHFLRIKENPLVCGERANLDIASPIKAIVTISTVGNGMSI